MSATPTASEADVLDAVLGVLTIWHVTAFRMNTGAVKFTNRFVRFGVQGMADIYAIPIVRGSVSGVRVCWTAPWFIEVKNERGRQSPEQKSFEEQVKSAGAEYFIVRSVEDMEAKLREHGVVP